MSLFTELKRRNVFRMALLYLGAAWLVMQVVDVLIERGTLPEPLFSVMLTVLAIGFPIALVISWFYEVTPEGILPDEEAAAQQGAAPAIGRAMDFVVIAVMAAALLVFAYDKWWTGPPPERSVAVLPFVNMSSNDEVEFLGAGLADTILNVLAQVPNLHVAARTSSFQSRLAGLGVREIANLLGVSSVLEGSIQRQGDRVRVTAQLIDAEDESHLWSKNFDRDYGDIFQIQDEIAESVASALELALLGETKQRIDREGTDNLAAFEAYSSAIENLRVRTTDSVLQAVEQLQRAVELDPDFARAHAMLGYAYLQGYYRSWSGLSDAELDEHARDAAKAALRIAPGLSTALTVLGILTDDVDARGELYREAVANDPNDAMALRFYTSYLFYPVYQTGEAMELAEKLIRLDPLDERHYILLSRQQSNQSMVREALETIARGKEKIPQSVALRYWEYEYYGALGDYSSMIRVTHESLAIDPEDYLNRRSIAEVYFNVGMPEEATRWWEHAAETAPEWQRDDLRLMLRTVLDVYYQRNDEEVFESLQRWVAEGLDWAFPGAGFPHQIFTEYGARLGKLDEVLSTFESLYPKLFADLPGEEKDVFSPFFVGAALVRAGDAERGEPLLRRTLESIERHARNGRVTGGYVKTLLNLGDIDAARDAFREQTTAARFGRGGLGQRFIMQYSPVWAPIRAMPEYAALMEKLDRNAAEQREKLRAMDLPLR